MSLGYEIFKGGIAKIVRSFISKIFKVLIHEICKGFVTTLVGEYSKVFSSMRSKGVTKGSARACTSLVLGGDKVAGSLGGFPLSDLWTSGSLTKLSAM